MHRTHVEIITLQYCSAWLEVSTSAARSSPSRDIRATGSVFMIINALVSLQYVQHSAPCN